jgi:hypothetical protein
VHTWCRTVVTSVRPRGIRAIVVGTMLLAVAIATPAVSGATSVAAHPHAGVPTSLPALHRVAGWVDAGLKLSVASNGVLKQLSENDEAWIPDSTCLSTAINSTNATPCVLGDTSSKTTVVLYGDSSADEWALDVGTLGRTDGFRVVAYLRAACPVGDIVVKLPGHSPDANCPVFRNDVLADLAAMQPAPSLVLVSELRLFGYETTSGKNVTNAAWSAALVHTLQQIQGDGLAVASLHGVPFDVVNPAQCIAANASHLPTCEIKVSDSDSNKWDQATRDGAIDADAGSIDVRPMFCDATACPMVADGAVTHSGGNHVTEQYSKDVGAAFGELVGCLVVHSFTNASKAAPVFSALNGTAPTSAFLKGCETLTS